MILVQKYPEAGVEQRNRIDLIEAMEVIVAAAQPITGRGVGYKLFTAGLIPSMEAEMQRVYRLLKEAREEGMIPWEWIVDESRELERKSQLGRPRTIYALRDQRLPARLLESAAGAGRSLVREGHHTRRSSARLDEYGVGFRVMHGFGQRHRCPRRRGGRRRARLIALYVGD